MEVLDIDMMAKLLLLLFLFSQHLVLIMSMVSSVELYPLVVVPGLATNEVDARLTRAYQPSNPVCVGNRKQNVWFRLWVDYNNLVSPVNQMCFAENMMLYYHRDIDDYRNVPGVETHVPFFGSTRGFLYKDPDNKESTVYMANLVKQLEQIGYVDGVNMFGAPYDFRYGLAAAGHPSRVGSRFLGKLKNLVEKASRLNGNRPVIILSHSLGGLFTLQLLNRNSPAWRQRFVKHFMALSAPWGGTVVEMLIFASGNPLNPPSPYIVPLIFRKETRSSESNMWLLPNPRTFGDKPLVVTPMGNFSATRMPEFLDVIGFEDGIHPYLTRTLPLVEWLEPPGVPVTVMTGYGVRTAETLVYGKEGFDVQPEIITGDGDGLVNLASLLAIESDWKEIPEQVLKVIKLPNVSHEGILNDEVPLREVIREVHQLSSFQMKFAA